MEFSCLKIKKTTYISGGILQSLENQEKKSALKKFVSYDAFTIFTAVKHGKFPVKQKYNTDHSHKK